MVGLHGVKDLVPDAGLPPALVAGIDCLPRTEVRWHFSPGGAGADDPEDAGQDGAVIEGRPAGGRFLGWEDGSDSCPLLIVQGEITRG